MHNSKAYCRLKKNLTVKQPKIMKLPKEDAAYSFILTKSRFSIISYALITSAEFQRSMNKLAVMGATKNAS